MDKDVVYKYIECYVAMSEITSQKMEILTLFWGVGRLGDIRDVDQEWTNACIRIKIKNAHELWFDHFWTCCQYPFDNCYLSSIKS